LLHALRQLFAVDRHVIKLLVDVTLDQTSLVSVCFNSNEKLKRAVIMIILHFGSIIK
jgi:hypothetical protein